ncbi:HAD-IC family P-type ATPase [Legionella maioricensis]|uniref:HAD-IC family P-type ATPase n=1 Tax=Legionella maioricensis TaxID=2896528 RepID=A0A9X2D2F6_9GAMM|nr:HAD-IC family P-type ATPase [Legionella maioricensis]MCL9685201.1 HAD-IC family P-type ATPase [Legionella maioricensis]MCL9688418.1 HAD-IC family P-type ATPase [Legionella maioricensis]
MTKQIIFQDSFLVSGIMCHAGCGNTIQSLLNNCLDECKESEMLPENAQLIMDAEPQALGVHRLFITIEGNEHRFNQGETSRTQLLTRLKASLSSSFDLIDNHPDTPTNDSTKINWINIIVNLLAMGAIVGLSVLFPPSLLLTIGLTSLTFLTTAFTAREYLINFFQNLRNNNNLANMTTTVTLGWSLSLAHTLFHAISMPLASSFSMIFMSFVMPLILITIINGMDEIKRQVLRKSTKMHLQGVKALFPQMSEEYPCYQLSQEQQTQLDQQIELFSNRKKYQEQTQLTQQVVSSNENTKKSNEFFQSIQVQLDNDNVLMEKKCAIKKGMIIKVNRGECFPVDCILIKGSTVVDPSLLTGESQQSKRCMHSIPAGAINLGHPVSVYATEDSYNSTVNKLLFRSNRARENITLESNRKFTYLYTALIAVGIVASITIPFALGILTIPLLLQNVTGILFAVCPCTMAIAHQLPSVLNMYQRNNKDITIRDENLCNHSHDIHTIVFDKTGTLTTGNSEVESSEGISSSLWGRVYLLEKQHGAEHPLAKAITNYYETRTMGESIFQDIAEASTDSRNRGLSGIVQGKQIHIGNANYLRHSGIKLPPLDLQKIEQGLSPVYVAEDKVYQGVIYIKHEVREDILVALNRLKREGKKIIMLTGDSQLSAIGFNQQNGDIFDLDDIYAEQTPQDKENFLANLMSSEQVNPKGVWFVGDGLNDAPCSRMVSEKGGISCAIRSDNKAAFFTDISLNGSLDYLFEHNNLNQFLKKNVLQNQMLLTYGAIAFLAFIISFSIAGIAVSPIIPLFIMASTTLFVLFNSYRVPLSIDHALDKKTSWLKGLLASDLSISLLAGASALFICGLLISTVATGGLALPAIVFTAGAAAAISSVCILGAGTLFGLFTLLTATYLFADKWVNSPVADNVDLVSPIPLANKELSSPALPTQEEQHDSAFNFALSTLNRKSPNEEALSDSEIQEEEIPVRMARYN